MSTLFFLKDHGGHKRGEKATVAFLAARDLVEQKIAVRWDGGNGEDIAKEIWEAEGAAKAAAAQSEKQKNK